MIFLSYVEHQMQINTLGCTPNSKFEEYSKNIQRNLKSNYSASRLTFARKGKGHIEQWFSTLFPVESTVGSH